MNKNDDLMEQFEQDLKILEESVRTHTAGYIHSTQMLDYTVTTGHDAQSAKTYEVQLDLRDMLILSAISGAGVIITGNTGGGKTTFAKGVVNAMFGENFGYLQMDAEFSLGQLRDVLFGTIQAGGRLSEAQTANVPITAPAVIIDEYNRAPSVVTNKIQGFLSLETITFDGGFTAVPGVVMPNGKRYQWKLATINEGSVYGGVNPIDKASRDRFVIEIPMDAFPPSTRDNIQRDAQESHEYNYEATRSTLDLRDHVFRLYEAVESMEMDPIVTRFSAYLLNKNNCYRSPEGTKLMFDNFTTQICQGTDGRGECEAYGPFGHVCGEVGAPSGREKGRIAMFAKALALYRRYKFPDTPRTVTMADYMATVQFGLYHKLEISPGWIEKYGGGSSWEATRVAMNQIEMRFMESLKALQPIEEKSARGEQLTAQDKMDIQAVFIRDPSMGEIPDMRDIYRRELGGRRINESEAVPVCITPSRNGARRVRV